MQHLKGAFCFFLQEAFIMSSKASFTFRIFLRQLYCIYEDVWSQNPDSGSVVCVRFLIQSHCFPDKGLFESRPISGLRSINFLFVSDRTGGGWGAFVVLWIHAYRIYGRIPHILVLMNERLNGLGGINGTNLLRKQQKGWQLIACSCYYESIPAHSFHRHCCCVATTPGVEPLPTPFSVSKANLDLEDKKTCMGVLFHLAQVSSGRLINTGSGEFHLIDG